MNTRIFLYTFPLNKWYSDARNRLTYGARASGLIGSPTLLFTIFYGVLHHFLWRIIPSLTAYYTILYGVLHCSLRCIILFSTAYYTILHGVLHRSLRCIIPFFTVHYTILHNVSWSRRLHLSITPYHPAQRVMQGINRRFWTDPRGAALQSDTGKPTKKRHSGLALR